MSFEERLKKVETKVSAQQINNSILAQRIFDLEEKERDRERIEYQKEMALVSKDLDAMEDGTYEYGEL